MPSSGFFPREHGATAMLLQPFVCGWILARNWNGAVLAALIAILTAFAMKEPLIVLLRQKLVWKEPHAEVVAARRWVAAEILLLVSCSIVLWLRLPLLPLLALAAGAALFGALAVFVNIRNKQRSVWFQVPTAIALASTALMASLAALGQLPRWAWFLWLLSVLQSVAAIFVVHARLDGRIAARKGESAPQGNRRAALGSVFVLVLAAACFALYRQLWIALALAAAAAGYWFDLRRQRHPTSLVMPLKQIGQQALALSILFGALVIVGLW